MKTVVASICLFISCSFCPAWRITENLTHKVGDEYLEGVIFYLYTGTDGAEHGLIVAKEERQHVRWQNKATLVHANSMTDGQENTKLLTFSPARTYVESLGEGWYLPSISELGLLWGRRKEVNATLSRVGQPFSKTTYWSSTEYVELSALDFDFNGGYSGGRSLKTHHFTVRAIKQF